MATTNKAKDQKNVIYLYNKTEDVLSMEKKKKGRVKASIDIGEVILDINDKGSVIGIEIFKASKSLQTTKDILSKITDARFSSRQGRDFLVVNLLLLFDDVKITHTTHLPITEEALRA
jgi:uncharacterized protein YuzE